MPEGMMNGPMRNDINQRRVLRAGSAQDEAPGAVRQQLVRILASTWFTNSERMCRFLRFAVEETLNGNAAHLKEVVIGASVFDREPNYDSQLDPIVRVEARRLRSKLASYYGGEGKEDNVSIEF